jgi:hypothetical protein
MLYVDNNPTPGGTYYSVSCRLQITSESGSVISSPTLYSCNSWGGCTSPSDGSFSGSFVFGITNFNLANGWINAVSFVCSLPETTSDTVHSPTLNNSSYLKMYQADFSYQ